MKLAAIAVIGAVLGSAHGSALPPPSFRVGGYPLTLAAAGPRVVVATSSCAVRLADLARGTKPVAVRQPAACRSDDPAAVDAIWLGRSALAAQTIDAPSPHGEQYALWTGPLPRGPLRQRGSEWGWTDSDVPAGYGCDWSVAAGGGIIALTQVPNRLAVDRDIEDKPACPAAATATAKVSLIGAAATQFTLAGSWKILATDGKRLVLTRLNTLGLSTGELALVDVHGTRLTPPPFAASVVKAAIDGWLTPQGVVLETAAAISGPGWTVRTRGAATVGYGRLFYAQGRTLRVRRIRGGADRALLKLPTSEALVAAGSFGLAIATGTETTTVYRVPWSTIDRTLPLN
ncbi:MAG: hypothetical protein ABI948_02620 [Thermoleophilia bacterium]